MSNIVYLLGESAEAIGSMGVDEPPGAVRRHRSTTLVIVVVLVALVGFGSTYYFLVEVAPVHRGGPANLGFTGTLSSAAPGSEGCANHPAEVCYATGLTVTHAGSALSALSFRVTQRTNADAAAPSIPLGPNATLTALSANDSVVGVWNWSRSTWTSGSQWGISSSQILGMVLDTGLVSNSTLAGGLFWAILSGQFGGQDSLPMP